ncbi:MAG: type and secretion system protein family protein [Nevskia sp.]|nr:type and secretion system protein family protein [Nevskia sp.]
MKAIGECSVLVGEARKQTQQRETIMRLPQSVGYVFKAGLLALAVTVCGAPVTASAQTPAAQTVENTVVIDVGTQQLLRQKQPIRRVAVANPEIADVSVINSRELLLNGKVNGVTSLIIWSRDAKAQPVTYKVEVSSRSISGSTADLLAHRDTVLAAGVGAPSAGGNGAAQAVADHTTVAVDTQVLSQVKIVDISRTALQEFGINFAHANSTGVMGAFTPGGLGSIGSATSGSTTTSGNQIVSGTGFLPIASAFNFVYASNQYLGAISVLESKGLARTLAEPSLTAMSGQTASFLAGGEFPFPTVQNGGGGGSSGNSITIIFKEFGIRLNLTPTVLARNRIALKVAPEVSELDYTNGISLNGITIPGLNVRRTDTMVELGDGETFVISGLVSNTLKNSVSKVPWIGDVPVIGAFFRNTSISRNDRELIMVVTPHLVRPMVRDAPLPELPGASLDQYNPSFAHTMFMETGKFGQPDSTQGYSR